MEITPDARVVFEVAGFPINATIFNTWIVMAVLTIGSALVTWRLRPEAPASRWRDPGRGDRLALDLARARPGLS
jgi:F-type H+-transporting ATPase subunit a